MNKLFGTSKKKEVAPTVDINAPTLAETSQRVRFHLELIVLDGSKRQSCANKD